MVTISNSIVAPGFGDGDVIFTATGLSLVALIGIASPNGQADNITSLTLDGSGPTSAQSLNTPGSLGHLTLYFAYISAGSHTLSVLTGLGVFRYGVTVDILAGVGPDAILYTDTSGTGTTAALSTTPRTPDNVVSWLLSEGIATHTPTGTSLSSQLIGTLATGRVRLSSAYAASGAHSWTLSSSSPWTIFNDLARGTAATVGVPTNVSVPVNVGVPTNVCLPSHPTFY